MAAMLNFLPGPVAISAEVQAAFATPPVWHRSDAFLEYYNHSRQQLKDIGKSKYIVLLMGSGTMANAVVAQEIKKLPARGLILANGEFGERLVRQARQAGLDFDVYATEWGQRFCPEAIKKLLIDKGWLWLVQCETSTGTVNLETWLTQYCQKHSIKLCLDSISAAGCMEVDFSHAYLASSTSGKGFESYAGIAMVFYNHEPEFVDMGHAYSDLFTYHKVESPPFTFSSNLLFALHTALNHTDYKAKYTHNYVHSEKLKQWLCNHNLVTPLVGAQQADHVWSIALDSNESSSKIGEALEQRGITLHYKNHYLQNNNWLQLTLMTNHSNEEIDVMLETFEHVRSTTQKKTT